MLSASSSLVQNQNMKLNQSREGFINRAVSLFNKLDEDTKICQNLNQFKREAKKWVKWNIPVKPL